MTKKKVTKKKATRKKKPARKKAKKKVTRKKPATKTAEKPRPELTFEKIKAKIKASGMDSLTPDEAKALGIYKDVAGKLRKNHKPKYDKVLDFPDVSLSEDEQIKEMFKSARLERMKALFDELKYGKGIARLQAETRISEIEATIQEETGDEAVDLDWDVFATTEAKESAG
jgi:hypothetical protein